MAKNDFFTLHPDPPLGGGGNKGKTFGIQDNSGLQAGVKLFPPKLLLNVLKAGQELFHASPA